MRADPLRAAAPFLALALLLILCLLLPLAFVPEYTVPVPSVEPDTDFASRIELLELYRAEKLESTGLDVAEAGSEGIEMGRRIFNAVMNNLVLDHGAATVEVLSGEDAFSLSQGGSSVRVLEFYREWNGDWHNWLRLWIDADELVIYRCYYSANVLENADEYINSYDARLKESVGNLCDALGFESSSVRQTGELTWLVTLTAPDGTDYVYYVPLLVYADSAPSLLVDIDISLVSVEASGGSET